MGLTSIIKQEFRGGAVPIISFVLKRKMNGNEHFAKLKF